MCPFPKKKSRPGPARYRRVLPCRFGFPPRHPPMPLAPRPKNCGFPAPNASGLVATPSLTLALPAASVTEDIQVEQPSHEVSLPTAHEASSSDCHPTRSFPFVSATRRVCLTRLRYACRFSQPLDVLFRSKPFQPCFVLVALMGFRLRRFPLASSSASVSRLYSASSSAGPSAGFPSVLPPSVPVQGFGHLVSPLPRPVLPGTRDPCLPWRFLPEGSSLGLGPALLNDVTNRRPFSRRPPLMGLV
jgi:hypothetical protein